MKPVYEDIQIDPLFHRINKNAVAFYIWKIQTRSLEILPKEEYGKFSDDSAYILYSASQKNAPISTQTTLERELKPSQPGSIERCIHFWLGEHVRKEIAKTAAYKIIELDVYLDHKTTQYRETQGHESPRFLFYFKENGLTVLSGARDNSISVTPRLFHIKGKTSKQCIQKSPISWDHFTSKRVLLLHTNIYVFIWVGKCSCSIERVHAIDEARKYSKLEIVFVDDGYEQSMDGTKKAEWNVHLPLAQRHVQPFEEGGPTPPAFKTYLKLYQCSYLNSIFRVELKKSGYLKQEDIANHSNVYIIDGLTNCILIWIGRGNNHQIYAEAMRHARGFVMKKNYPAHTLIIRAVDGSESAEFTNLFPKWVGVGDPPNASISNEQFDAPTIIHRPKLAAQIQLIDDGSGNFTVYQINDFNNIVDVPRKSAHIFFSENCYIVHYQTVNPSDPKHIPKHIVYQWSGKACPQERINHGDIALKQICDHLDKNVVQFKLAEGFEIAHFLQIFYGKLTIFRGKPATDRDIPSNFILKVSGNCTYNSKAIQILGNAQSCSSENCYIIRNNRKTWIWCSQTSTGDEREMAKAITANLVMEFLLEMESKESDDFLASVGDMFLSKLKKSDYISVAPALPNWSKDRVSLYRCSLDQDEKFFIDKIVQFTQKDLSPDGIYLLDIGNVVYIWIGIICEKHELTNLLWTMATTLISWHPVDRDINLPIGLVRQECEPITFTGFFDNWSNKHFDSFLPYETLRYNTESTGDVPVPLPRFISANSEQSPANSFDKYQKFPLNVLRSDVNQLPSNVNLTMKENYLTHDDFVTVFQMSYSDFQALPKWKQIELKKQHKLF